MDLTVRGASLSSSTLIRTRFLVTVISFTAARSGVYSASITAVPPPH